MREILFRSKTEQFGNWIEGSLIVGRNLESGQLEYFIAPLSAYYTEVKKVIPETVGQYTGLTDKNGQKIFENDIVNIENRKYRVSFEKGCWVILGESEFWDFLQTNVKGCEIVGNIFDKPELLGNK